MSKTGRQQLKSELHAELDRVLRSIIKLASLRGTPAEQVGRAILQRRLEAIRREIAKLPEPRRDRVRK